LKGGAKVEGIFRVSGRQQTILELKKLYDKGEFGFYLLILQGHSRIDLSKLDAHTVAGILKLWFRELPQPIFTFEYYDAFKWAMSKENGIFC
jgi:hypothetical protein